MTNELLLIASLAVSYGGTLFMFRMFGKGGIFSWLIVCTILANIEVSILVNAFGMEQTLGNTLFAATFLATDILSECYGSKVARQGVFIGIAGAVAFIFFSRIWMFYIPSENDVVMPAVKSLFSNTPRILVSSFIGFAVSELFDIWAYDKWWAFSKKISGDKERFLWLRNNGSTLISQAINIVIFNFGAFYKTYDLKTLVSITWACYVVYIVTSLLDTPFVYLGRMIFKKRSGLEAKPGTLLAGVSPKG